MIKIFNSRARGREATSQQQRRWMERVARRNERHSHTVCPFEKIIGDFFCFASNDDAAKNAHFG